MLLVAQKLGGVCAGAFDDNGRMLGFVFGVTGLKDGAMVHWSDMLAVHPEAQGHNLGQRLKEYQRQQCRAMGLGIIYWTYDPLVARNAHLNLSRMGARAAEYVEAMYGEGTNSPLQGDMPTDRFVVAWPVDSTLGAVAVREIADDTPLWWETTPRSIRSWTRQPSWCARRATSQRWPQQISRWRDAGASRPAVRSRIISHADTASQDSLLTLMAAATS